MTHQEYRDLGKVAIVTGCVLVWLLLSLYVFLPQ